MKDFFVVGSSLGLPKIDKTVAGELDWDLNDDVVDGVEAAVFDVVVKMFAFVICLVLDDDVVKGTVVVVDGTMVEATFVEVEAVIVCGDVLISMASV